MIPGINLGRIARTVLPLAVLALGASLSACDGANISINGKQGKKLSELDLAGKSPSELVLLGPDEVRVTTGEKLAITVEGDPEAAEHLRFTLDDNSLGVMRDGKGWQTGKGVAIVNVTMPAPGDVTMAGSGRILLAALAPQASVTVAGSGTIEAPQITADTLKLTIAGSGNYKSAGRAAELDLTVAGSGSAQMEGLHTDRAKISIAGSGDAVFSSDGDVDASLMGSGTVTVRGRARCTVSSIGSGRLVCENGTVESGRKKAA